MMSDLDRIVTDRLLRQEDLVNLPATPEKKKANRRAKPASKGILNISTTTFKRALADGKLPPGQDLLGVGVIVWRWSDIKKVIDGEPWQEQGHA